MGKGKGEEGRVRVLGRRLEREERVKKEGGRRREGRGVVERREKVRKREEC